MICDGEKEERENDFNNMMKDKNEREKKVVSGQLYKFMNLPSHPHFRCKWNCY